MRTTVRIEDELLRELKKRAVTEKVSLTKLFDRLLRRGLENPPVKRARYRERVFSMGAPRIPVDKALALAAAMEDEETVRKLAARK